MYWINLSGQPHVCQLNMVASLFFFFFFFFSTQHLLTKVTILTYNTNSTMTRVLSKQY